MHKSLQGQQIDKGVFLQRLKCSCIITWIF